MIWTIIYRDPSTQSLLSTVMPGPHGKSDTLSLLDKEFDGDVLAIIAGDQVVYFNKTVEQRP